MPKITMSRILKDRLSIYNGSFTKVELLFENNFCIRDFRDVAAKIRAPLAKCSTSSLFLHLHFHLLKVVSYLYDSKAWVE